MNMTFCDCCSKGIPDCGAYNIAFYTDNGYKHEVGITLCEDCYTQAKTTLSKLSQLLNGFTRVCRQTPCTLTIGMVMNDASTFV